MGLLGTGLAVAALVAAVLAFLLGRSLERTRQRKEVEAARDDASRIRKGAEEEADSLRRTAELQAKETRLQLRESWEAEENRRRAELERREQRLAERSLASDRKSDQLDRREDGISQQARELDDRRAELGAEEQAVAERQARLDDRLAEARARLEALAGITADDAKVQIVSEVTDEARAEAASQVRLIKEEAQRTAEREGRRVLAMAIQRMAADTTAQLTVSVVQLRSDEMKGRIIGREGRNIRAFEQATGIDVIIDDTPEAVVLSGYNPVRREIARLALSRLIEDGRIHPGRIEEVVAKAGEDIEVEMREAAEEVLYDLGIHGVHDEIVKVLGRLKFRTSYGQNQLAHAREVALLAGTMAAEMGLDVPGTRRAGLLHDVGKGMTDEQELTHVELGHRLCKRYGESDLVLNAIRAHHDEEPHRFAEAWLVTAADAISGSRPGARRDMFEGYVRRLEKLEGIAIEHPGVERCFAIQAGRELRVMVEPGRVDDDGMTQISQAVARRIEDELQYPGQIKVVVIRETRSVDFAR